MCFMGNAPLMYLGTIYVGEGIKMIDDFDLYIADLLAIQEKLESPKDKAVMDLTLWMVRGIQKMDAIMEMHSNDGGTIQ